MGHEETKWRKEKRKHYFINRHGRGGRAHVSGKRHRSLQFYYIHRGGGGWPGRILLGFPHAVRVRRPRSLTLLSRDARTHRQPLLNHHPQQAAGGKSYHDDKIFSCFLNKLYGKTDDATKKFWLFKKWLSLSLSPDEEFDQHPADRPCELRLPADPDQHLPVQLHHLPPLRLGTLQRLLLARVPAHTPHRLPNRANSAGKKCSKAFCNSKLRRNSPYFFFCLLMWFVIFSLRPVRPTWPWGSPLSGTSSYAGHWSLGESWKGISF